MPKSRKNMNSMLGKMSRAELEDIILEHELTTKTNMRKLKKDDLKDLIKESKIFEEEKKHEKIDVSNMKLNELKEYVEKHDIKLPKKGSGKNGDLIKIDYVHAVEDYKSDIYPKKSIRVTSSRKSSSKRSKSSSVKTEYSKTELKKMKHSELSKLCKVMGIEKCLYEDLPRKNDIIELILNAQKRRGLSPKKSYSTRDDCRGRECFYKSKSASELRDLLYSRKPSANIFVDDLDKKDLIEELLKLDYEKYGPETLGSLSRRRESSRRMSSPYSRSRRSQDDRDLPENVRAVQSLLLKESPSLRVKKSEIPTRTDSRKSLRNVRSLSPKRFTKSIRRPSTPYPSSRELFSIRSRSPQRSGLSLRRSPQQSSLRSRSLVRRSPQQSSLRSRSPSPQRSGNLPLSKVRQDHMSTLSSPLKRKKSGRQEVVEHLRMWEQSQPLKDCEQGKVLSVDDNKCVDSKNLSSRTKDKYIFVYKGKTMVASPTVYEKLLSSLGQNNIDVIETPESLDIIDSQSEDDKKDKRPRMKKTSSLRNVFTDMISDIEKDEKDVKKKDMEQKSKIEEQREKKKFLDELEDKNRQLKELEDELERMRSRKLQRSRSLEDRPRQSPSLRQLSRKPEPSTKTQYYQTEISELEEEPNIFSTESEELTLSGKSSPVKDVQRLEQLDSIKRSRQDSDIEPLNLPSKKKSSIEKSPLKRNISEQSREEMEKRQRELKESIDRQEQNRRKEQRQQQEELKKEKLEREKLEREKLEREEQLELEQLERKRLELEQLERKLRQQQEELEREQRQQQEQLERKQRQQQEQLGREQLGREQLGREQLEREQLGREQLGREQLGREQQSQQQKVDKPPNVEPGKEPIYMLEDVKKIQDMIEECLSYLPSSVN